MAAASDAYLRTQLEDRRKRLQAALASPEMDGVASELLVEVNSALERMNQGTFGICEECHDTIESDRLLADPLIRFCVDHLSEPERRALESDMELANRVQRRLLPARDLRADGWHVHYSYEPAGAVSGDYCDVIPAENGEGELFLSVGDVAGKGVAASMLMAHLHAMFRSLNGVGLPLAQLLVRANRLFCESINAGQYATLVCGRAKASGDVEISSAGHLPALLLRNGEARPVGATGLPLGMFRSGNYPIEKMHLESGESLVLYTDGVTETLDEGNQEYGLARLARFFEKKRGLAPEALVAACQNEMRNFSSGAAPKDDRTILILQRA
jgi:phosphoserine phosphatase RsbU/P